MKAIKSEYSKKIKKQKKVSKLSYKGEEYNVDNWAQCDKCHMWRKVTNNLEPNDKFKCDNIGKKCYAKEKIEKDYISL